MTTPVRLFPASVDFPTTCPASGFGGLGCQLGDLNLSGKDGFGVSWRTFTLTGLDGSPSSSAQPTQNVRGPGGWLGPRNLAPKSIVIGGRVEAPTDDAMQDAIDRLNAAVTLNDTLLTYQRGSKVRSVIVSRADEVLFTENTGLSQDWSVQLQAAEPRKFFHAEQGDSFLPSSTGGIVVPLVVPLVVSSTDIAGTVSLTNPGNAAGPVTVRIDGPATGPVITHVTSGLTVRFDTDSPLVLDAGEYLLVDMEARLSLANGVVSRNAYIAERGWSAFLPGVNLWSFGSASYDPATKFTVTATPAWQ